MELRYWIADPSGNTTALVKEGFPAELRRKAAALLMETGEVEQVGFLSAPRSGEAKGRLEMAGGEFCGNATLSVAVWKAENLMLISPNRKELKIECTGAEAALCCAAWNIGGVEYGAVEMPLPSRIYERTFSAGGRTGIFSVVEAPGITHLLWPVDDFGDAERNFALSGIKGWCTELGVEALGVILCSRDFSRIAPLVFVPESDTLVWENGCGSGTAALGAFLAKEGGSLEKEVLQPGGTIRVRAECRKGILSLLQISEAVTFSEEKVLQI
ncbi:MAG TPA: hypothetical protein PLU82_02065 [Oscillospiraceae bacterium]|nr:hypothetical protein [Oscillospiraceae bacterium]